MTENGVLYQAFHWHSAGDGSHWRTVANRSDELKRSGFSAIWLPPACKAAGGETDTGYGVYDLFDLGEFEQKGSVRTKYGTAQEFLAAVSALQKAGLHVYADTVLNHKVGGDECEEIEAREVDRSNRNAQVTEPYMIRAWTRFTFPGRRGKYSDFSWSAEHFISVDRNENAPNEEKLYLLSGKTFSGEVSFEHGNYDHLLGCDVDMYHNAVRGEIFSWANWFMNMTSVDGLRLDAVKHIPASLFRDLLGDLRARRDDREILCIGEYWAPDLAELEQYLGNTEGAMKLFDVPLHYRFFEAGRSGRDFDMRTLFDGTLTASAPLSAVTFVDNHDSQPGQALESWVEDWFKPIAYACILLRDEGYPCVFEGDYLGAEGDHPPLTSHRFLLDRMLETRAKYNTGEQHNLFDHPNCIGWMRANTDNETCMVVIASNGERGTKTVETPFKGATFTDVTGHESSPIQTDSEGRAEFTCPGGSLSIWVHG